VQLARDARSSGDPVAAENYYQHAEHYFRLIAAAQEQFRQNQPQRAPTMKWPGGTATTTARVFSHFGQEPGFVPMQPQPFVPRDNLRAITIRAINSPRDHQREGQPYQPREHGGQREHRPQPQFQPQPQPQPQPVIADASVDRLPSFITGPQPQISGGPGFEGGEARTLPAAAPPAARPRPEGMVAPTAPGDDFNPGNE